MTKQIFPSKVFGEATGLNWIWTDWKLPKNMTPDEAYLKFLNLQKGLDDESTAKVSRDGIYSMYMEILRLNPELKKLPEPETFAPIFNAIHGAISKFNFDDIKFYSGLTMPERAEYNSDIKQRLRVSLIANKAGLVHCNWVLSPTTMKRVEAELNITDVDQQIQKNRM